MSEPDHAAKHRRSEYLHCAILGFSLTALIIAVVVSGVAYNKHNVKKYIKDGSSTLTTIDNSNPSVTAVNFSVDLTNFDTVNGLSYFTYISTSSDIGSEPFACALVYGVEAQIPTPLTVTGDTATNTTGALTALSDGLSSQYPFDVYETELFMAIGTPDQVSTCNGPFNVTVAPFNVQISQSLEGFSATFWLYPTPADEGGAPGIYSLLLIIKRDGTIRFFAVVMYIVTWLLTLAVVVATAQVIAYHSEPGFELVGANTALLFALPTIRSSMPGIPTTPTVSDAVGYYWHIALLGLSASALVMHSVWKLRAERYEQDRARKRISRRISPPLSDDYGRLIDQEKVPMMKP